MAWKADLAAVLVLLGAVNLLFAFVVDGAASHALHIGAATLAVAGAMARGYGADELGLARRDAPRSLAVGAIVSALIIGVVVLVAIIPATRSSLEDDRFLDTGFADGLFEVALRIPIVTALTEELLFRSVLLAVLLRACRPALAVLWSSLLFGLWHVLTTIGDLDGNQLTDDLGGLEAAGSVAGVVIATGLGGAVLAVLRLRTRGVGAPWLVHTTINSSVYLAGVIVVTGGHV